jgi:MFS family permease
MQTEFWRDARFTRYWLGDIASVLANQMLVLAVGWQIYEITNSALSLGLVGLAHFGAQIACTLPAGHVADRYDRRRVALICQITQGASALLLAAGSYYGWLDSAIIYACVFVNGMSQTFQNPALRALLPSLVAPEALPRCIAFHAALKKGAIIAGPALGGVVYLLGASVVYITGTVFFAVAGAVIIGIRMSFTAPRHAPLSLGYMLGGVRYIFGRPVILGAISLDLFATLLGGAVALLPIYARDILQTGPWGLGLLRSAPALGAGAGRGAGVAMAGARAAHARRRTHAVRVGGGVRHLHRGVRLLDLAAAVTARTRHHGRGRHGERGDTLIAGATRNTR